MLPRPETSLNLQGCPKLSNRSQSLVGRSSPYYEDMCRRYCYLTSFFSIVNATCLSCEDMARQSCAMGPRWRFFASCIYNELRSSARAVQWLDHDVMWLDMTPCAVEHDVRCVPQVRGSIRAAARVRRVRLRKTNYVKIIPMHMMIKEIIPGRQQRVRRCPL